MDALVFFYFHLTLIPIRGILNEGKWHWEGYLLDNLTSIKEESRNLVGYKLSKSLFEEFKNPNNRLIIGVTCLKDGHKKQAVKLLQSIVEEGPKEHKDHHFAYVRSLVEMAELRAEEGDFLEAEENMRLALEYFPNTMGYMMSRIHLEVYLSYYCFCAGKEEVAYQEIATICEREQEKFRDYPIEDAYELVGPGLRYAIHQWSLFFAQNGEWKKAVEKIKEAFRFMADTTLDRVEAQRLEKQSKWEQAFYSYEEAVY